MSLALGFWIAAEIGSTTWEGPDVTAGNPIMLRLILRDLWNAYSGTVMRMLAGAFVAAVVLWGRARSVLPRHPACGRLQVDPHRDIVRLRRFAAPGLYRLSADC